ncbi:MAG TPA: polyprenyl synthetase family protein [Bacteroidetes bacterium]|nr:polyprenyl synthetase family protein [Bacteroidota bacterium]
MTTEQFNRRYLYLRRLIDARLVSGLKNSEPRDLMQGSRYVLAAPGKRVRPILMILSCEAVGGRVKDAIDAAVAIEMLHNFTLVHDDVMDNAPSRRGRATVHTKWNLNNAILVGDVILGLAYRTFLKSKTNNIRRATEIFTESFIEVCEGQAFDLEYEHRPNISPREYSRMISKKTGKLIASATELGAILGNATPKQTEALRSFGRHVGRAFQIQDDLLDVVANEKDLGKKIGGDIVEGKTTFLLVHALRRSRGAEKARLRKLTTRRATPVAFRHQRQLVKEVTSIYERSGAIEAARTQIRQETVAGVSALDALAPSNSRAMLEWVSAMLVRRTY